MLFEKHKKAKQTFNDIDKNPENFLIILYSCESFYEITDDYTPRITSIAVCYYFSGQAEAFLIHKTAEKEHIKIESIESKFDDLEKVMLPIFG